MPRKQWFRTIFQICSAKWDVRLLLPLCITSCCQLFKWERFQFVIIYICCSHLDAIATSGRGKSLYLFIRRGNDGSFIARWPASWCVSTAAPRFLQERAPFLNACISDSLSTSTAAGMESSWISPRQARCLNLGREEPDCNHSKGLHSNLSLTRWLKSGGLRAKEFL